MGRSAFAAIIAVALATGSGAAAQTAAPSPAETQALDLLKHAIGFRTVIGEGNQTFEYATYLKGKLVEGGFAAEDVTVTRVDDTAYLVARYRGTGKASNGAKPILISGHMDVVEAKPEDWERDPFTAVVENGYIYGRGATDMKYDLSTMVASLIALKKQGFKPGRDIILLASGDEETTMKTTAMMAEQYHDAEILLNIDGGGGEYDEAGKPVIFGVQGAEKTYADFQLEFTNAGGHSSAPRKVNAIYQLSAVLGRIGAYEFPAQINDITRASFLAAADQAKEPLAGAMRRFAADPQDKEALAILRADPAYVGQTGTTCVATMVNAGHALNALPQRATANINCRIFPGVAVADVMATLKKVANDPDMKITELDSGTVASPASPVTPELMNTISGLIHKRFPGVPVVPTMSAGASDSLWFRAKGVPSYGISPIFMKNSDHFSHGLNERTPLSEMGPSVTYYQALLKALAN